LSAHVDIIVGLGNPGTEYANTRHNSGFWFVDEVARHYHTSFKSEKKFNGDVARATICGRDVLLLKPATFMNLSGQALQPLMTFYKVKIENVLVVHDELDLPVGTIRLKVGGGHGGHNGLRDIIARCGGNTFQRLRIGIGHPGEKHQVTNHVLKKASSEDQSAIEESIRRALAELELIVSGDSQKAMHKLHSD
jgi:PTH1 family peptidyl-tRNA hydrolase